MAHMGEILKSWIEENTRFGKVTDFMEQVGIGAGTLYNLIGKEEINPKSQRKFLERLHEKNIDATELQRRWDSAKDQPGKVEITEDQIQTVFDLLDQYRSKENDWMQKEKSYLKIIENLTNGKTA